VKALIEDATGFAENASHDAALATHYYWIAKGKATEAAHWASQAAGFARQADTYAKNAAASAAKAQQSAIVAANSAKVARNAANSAVSSARSAQRSAQRADRAATSARGWATRAAGVAAKARTDAEKADKDATEAARAWREAVAKEAALINKEMQERPGGQPEEPSDLEGSWDSATRLTNKLNGSNKLAEAAVKLWGGTCFPGKMQVICIGVKTPNNRPMTVGDYLLYPYSLEQLRDDLKTESGKRNDLYRRGIDASIYGPDLLNHEAAHSNQWSRELTPLHFLSKYYTGTAFSYIVTGTDGRANPFEIGANPWKGEYWDADESWWDVFGPNRYSHMDINGDGKPDKLFGCGPVPCFGWRLGD
jgi:hypothetical protein